MSLRTVAPGIGILGTGGWGRNLARVFAAHAPLVMCCGRTPGAAPEWLRAEHPGVAFADDVDEVLRRPDVDAVVVATPIATHAEFARRALTAGKHVFVEKPVATRVDDARAVVAASIMANRRLFVGHTFLFHPVFEQLAAIGRADPVVDLRISWLKTGTFADSVLWNLLPHDVAISLRLFGSDPAGVTLTECRGRGRRPDALAARLDFVTGSASLRVDRCAPVASRTVTVTTASGAVYAWSRATLHELRGETFVPVFESDEEPLAREAAAFLGSVADGRPTLSDGDLGARVVEVLARLDAAGGGDADA